VASPVTEWRENRRVLHYYTNKVPIIIMGRESRLRMRMKAFN